MKKILLAAVLLMLLTPYSPAFAGGTEGTPGKISGHSVGAAALSLIVWPGIGQVVNENPKDKNITHAVLGLTGIFRFWSCYDALVDRTGGVWHNRI